MAVGHSVPPADWPPPPTDRRRDHVREHGTTPAAEDQVLLSVEYGDMGQALARLSPEMRAVIQAVVLDGLTAKEAARLLRVPVSSVKTRLYRAKAHLGTTLAEGLS